VASLRIQPTEIGEVGGCSHRLISKELKPRPMKSDKSNYSDRVNWQGFFILHMNSPNGKN
jgi:hypothetical protein